MRDGGIGSWPARRTRTAPDAVALLDRGRTTTYRELHDRCTRLAHGLRGAGVQRGDRVVYLGPNGTEFVETMVATARLGAVFVPMNTRLTPPETAYILGNCAPKLFIWSPPFQPILDAEEVAGLGLQTVGLSPRAGETPYGSLFVEGEVAPIDEPITLDDLLMIQYTSGTSGRPKGVMLTHGNITWNVFNLMVDVDLGGDEIALVAAPMFHTAALSQQVMAVLLKGGTAILEQSWDADSALEKIGTHHVTHLFGVTTMYLSLLHSPKWADADLSSLRTLICGGSPVPETLLRQYAERGITISQAYGLTETSPGATFLRAVDGLRKLGSAGTPHFWSDVRLVDAEFRDTQVGQTGEVLVQGPNVTPGYWQNPKATRDAFLEDGWIRTGDLATRDSEGFFYIVDRLKDMIISGGENVYPAEVEAAIYEHPGVAECAVVGVPDPKWGEVGRAVVVAKAGQTLTEDAILEVLGKNLARYKIPKSVVFVEHLPHNASGKLLRREVKDTFGAG